MRILFVFLILFKVYAQEIQHPKDFHQPFWKTKPDVQKKISEEGLIVVSAKTTVVQEKPKLYLMKVVTGGAVKTPLDFTFKTISDYSKLKNVDTHFKESIYDKDKKTVYLHMEALGYHAYMHIKLNEIDVPDSKGKIKQIHWECIKGQFVGMKGVLQAEEIERQKTEISMTADYRSETLPLPKVLMGLGLEVVGRQVATQMRQYILDQYRDQEKAKSK
jgi:uncharacterized membrane protein